LQKSYGKELSQRRRRAKEEAGRISEGKRKRSGQKEANGRIGNDEGTRKN